MKKRNLSIFAFVVLIGLLFSCSPSTTSSSEPIGESYSMVKEIARVASKNDPSITTNGLLSSLGLKGEEEFTYKTMIVALRKAFPSLEEPSPYYESYHQYEDNDLYPIKNYEELPKDVQEAIAYFKNRSLFFPKEGSDASSRYYYFPAEEKANSEELRTILERIQGYIGKSPEDDFYSYINHDELFSTNITQRSNLVSTKALVENVKEFIASIKDDNKKRIDSFLASYNNEAIKESDYSGLKTAIDNIKNASSLLDLCSQLRTDFNQSHSSVLAPFLSVARQNGNNAVYLANRYAYPYSYKETCLNDISFLTSALKVLDAVNASEYASNLRSFLSTYFSCLRNKIKVDQQGNEIITNKPIDDSASINGCFSLKELYEEKGYDVSKIFVYYASEYDALIEALSKEDRLNDSKAYLLYLYGLNYSSCLPKNKQKALGIYGDVDSEESFYSYVIPYIANEVASSYRNSEEYQKNYSTLNGLFKNLKITFEKRLDTSAWLDEVGKEKAKQKLKNMDAVIFDKDLEDNVYLFPTHEYEEDSLYRNMNIYRQKMMVSIKNSLNESPFNPYLYSLNPLEANAFNDISNNAVCLTLGYLFSKENAFSLSIEDLFADFAFPLSHEIVHSFDENGLMYDENCNFSKDWLGRQNLETFQTKSEKVSTFYSNFEEVPGFKENGAIKVNEAIADLGGLNIVTDYSEQQKNFDYKKFFSRLARNNLYYVDLPYYYSYLRGDEHPIGKGRVNPLFMNSTKFLETYQVKENDYMYLSNEDSLNIW